MEWTAVNVIISILFIAVENAAYFMLRKTSDKTVSAICAFCLPVVYAAMFFFLFAGGADMRQTMLLLLLSLPCAFIPMKDDEEAGK